MSFQFGDFSFFCNQASLTLCTALKLNEPECYSRNVDFNGFLMFQPSTLVIHIVALVMTMIMIYSIKSKYTAVGRKEMVMFFYLYMIDTALEFLLLSNIIPISSPAYPIFAAAHVAAISATCWILLLNGFVGFQWAEDGTSLSLWSFRGSGLGIFGIVFFITLATIQEFAGFSRSSTTVLYFIYFIFNGALLLMYAIMQMILVVNTLEDRWPLGNMALAVLFFITAQVCIFAFNTNLCDLLVHYVDGMFFGTIFTLLSVMMVYKYWDSITKEDLEFSVGTTTPAWESKEYSEGHVEDMQGYDMKEVHL